MLANKRQLSQCIFHIDMDAFYVSVERLLNPDLCSKPVVVGKDHARGVISAASYEARKYNVFSAMSCVKAKQLCPDLIFVYSGRKYYEHFSKIVMDCIRTYSPLVEVVGIDEAYLEATGMHYLYANPFEMAKKLQEEIYQKTGGLTCSIGIAPLKFLAKICSDLNKPHGIYELKEENVEEFIKNLDLYKIPSVGKKFLKSLHELNIHTGNDALFYSKEFFERKFGKQGTLLYDRIHAIDDSTIQNHREPKSESAEITLEEDTKNKEILKEYLKIHAQRIGKGLREKKKTAAVITLKIKYKDFNQFTRQLSLSVPTCADKSIYEAGLYLLDKEELIKDVRLIGLSASQFDAKIKASQASLLDLIPTQKNNNETQKAQKEKVFDTQINTENQRQKVDNLIDSIKNKYGTNIVK